MAQDKKREAIIDAAIKRFAHFGVSKTTMAEIAADLSISKASLYYYFPDKLNLYADVLTEISKNGTQAHEETLAKEKDPFKAILFFLEVRTSFIVKYYNILEFLRSFNPASVPAELEPVFTQLKKNELKRLTMIIEKGVQSGQFHIADSRKTAELFFDFMEGFRTSILLRSASLFPEKKQFESILKREKEFAMIFFNGLTIKIQ